MKRRRSRIRQVALVGLCSLALSACATNPNALPEPGSKQWYQLRLQEIEAAKAAGQLTEEQYLSLKNEADATRAAHLDAMRRNDYPPVGVVFGFGVGHVHGRHHH